MENSSKKRRNCSRERDVAPTLVDRISNLPDPVLCYILSLLPRTEDAVRTSILSRRWKFLWTGVSSFYLYDIARAGRPVCKKKKKRFFEQFVNRVLLLSKVQSINMFFLSCQGESEPLCFNTWVSTAIIRNVQVLNVNRVGSFVELPSCLFTCGTLEILHLSGSLEINAPSLVCLPKLIYLQLEAVEYKNDESIPKLVSGCPILEFLDFVRKCDHVEIYEVSSPSLKSLCFHALKGCPRFHAYKVVINTPALERLDFRAHISKFNYVTLESMTSLVRADINVQVFLGDDPPDSDVYNPAMELVKALHHVESLTLTHETIKALSYATTCLSATRFERLTKLVVQAVCCDWTCIQDLLEAAVNLKSFDLTKCVSYEDDFESCWKNPEQVPRCLTTSLIEISFRGLYGCEDELVMIGFILKHGRVLKQMQLHSAVHDINTKFQLTQKILLFRRRSRSCKIEFY